MKTKVPMLLMLLFVFCQQAFANNFPIVSITSPVNGNTFYLGEKITLAANASDNGGYITKVEFYVNTTKLSTDFTAPYSIQFDALTEGSFTLSAKAFDNNNASSIASVNIIIATGVQAPYSGIPSILPGKVEAENYDKGGKNIAYFDNSNGNQGGAYRNESVDILSTSDAGGGYNIGWVSQGEWLEYTVNVQTAGKYTFVFRAATPYGLRKMHLEVNGVDISGPITLVQTSGITNYNNTTKFGLTLAKGEQVIRLVMDTDGFNLNYFEAIKENELPTVALTNPMGATTYDHGEAVTLSANASDIDGTISKVEFYCGSTKVGEDKTAPYTATWIPSVLGLNYLTAKAIDNKNAVTTSSKVTVNVAILNDAPVVTIMSPSDGDIYPSNPLFSSPTINIAATDDGIIKKVELFNGTTKVASYVTPPYVYKPSLGPGTYTFTAVATDDSSATTTSAPVTFTISDSDNCIVSTKPSMTEYFLDNIEDDTRATPRHSYLENVSEGLGVYHIVDGKDNIWLTQHTKSFKLEAGKQYTISFDVRIRYAYVWKLQLAFPEINTYHRLDMDILPYTTPPASYQVQDVALNYPINTYITKSVTFTSNYTKEVNLAFNILCFSSAASELWYHELFFKNISICETGSAAPSSLKTFEESLSEGAIIGKSELMISSEENLPMTVELYDMQGRKVYSHKGITNQPISIDPSLASGSYILNASYGNEFKQMKFVKQE